MKLMTCCILSLRLIPEEAGPVEVVAIIFLTNIVWNGLIFKIFLLRTDGGARCKVPLALHVGLVYTRID